MKCVVCGKSCTGCEYKLFGCECCPDCADINTIEEPTKRPETNKVLQIHFYFDSIGYRYYKRGDFKMVTPPELKEIIIDADINRVPVDVILPQMNAEYFDQSLPLIF